MAELPCREVAFELLSQILEVCRTDAQFKHFLDYRQEINQRANRAPHIKSKFGTCGFSSAVMFSSGSGF